MFLEKVYKAYGKALPDRSAFRSAGDISYREVIKEYKSWGRFVAAYTNYVAEQSSKVKMVTKPFKKVEKKVEDKKKSTLHS